LDEREILVRRGGNHGLMSGDHPGDVPRMDKGVFAKKVPIEAEKAGVMGEFVEHFDSLGVVVSGHADSDVQTHLVFRNLINGREVDPGSVAVLTRFAPAVAFHHGEHQDPESEDLLSGQEIPEIEKAIPLSAFPKGRDIAE